MIACKAPPFTARAWTALNLALRHLTLGETSVLHRTLVDTQLATSVDAHLYPTNDPYLAVFEIYATEKGSYDAIEKVVFSALDELHKKLLTTTELNLLKTFDRAQELVSRDGTFNIAAQLGEYVATGSWERYLDGLTELQSITAKEVQTAVRTYLLPEYTTIGTIVKKN
jgi:predicted Zn-dependent peptidase